MVLSARLLGKKFLQAEWCWPRFRLQNLVLSYAQCDTVGSDEGSMVVFVGFRRQHALLNGVQEMLLAALAVQKVNRPSWPGASMAIVKCGNVRNPGLF